MAKKKSIPLEEIHAAAYASWVKQGYHGTGVRDLAADIGFTIASLMHRVGSKEKLMIAVVRHCRESWNASMTQLNQQELPWQLRQQHVQELLQQTTPTGSLLAAILGAEFPSLPPGLQGESQEYLGNILGWLVRLLTEARRRGETPATQDPQTAATDMLAHAFGHHLLRRSQAVS